MVPPLTDKQQAWITAASLVLIMIGTFTNQVPVNFPMWVSVLLWLCGIIGLSLKELAGSAPPPSPSPPPQPPTVPAPQPPAKPVFTLNSTIIGSAVQFNVLNGTPNATYYLSYNGVIETAQHTLGPSGFDSFIVTLSSTAPIAIILQSQKTITLVAVQSDGLTSTATTVSIT